MDLDQNRIRDILAAPHSYYAGSDTQPRVDERWDLGPFTDFIARHLHPTDRVLDAGCGKGHILLELRDHFASGLGVDNDPEHIRMAEQAKDEQAAGNVDFRLLDYPAEAAGLPAESFDLILSIRGPVPDTAEGVRAAWRLLRPDGLLFCHEIGEDHGQEVDEIFSDHVQFPPQGSLLQKYRRLLEANGFAVRLAADNYSKIYHADVYAWLARTCNIWSWLGMPLPAADDPRIREFAEKHSIATGEIETTGHVSWIGAVKRERAGAVVNLFP